MIPSPQCLSCARFRSPFLTSNFAGPATCEAFPDAIPDAVFGNELDHRQPIDGDHGIRFQAAPGQQFPAEVFETATR